jgi:hypothetical protein
VSAAGAIAPYPAVACIRIEVISEGLSARRPEHLTGLKAAASALARIEFNADNSGLFTDNVNTAGGILGRQGVVVTKMHRHGGNRAGLSCGLRGEQEKSEAKEPFSGFHRPPLRDRQSPLHVRG